MALSLNLRQRRGLYLRKKRDESDPSAAEKDGDQMIKSTQELLKKGETEIVLDDKHKNVIMILGNTGSGKSTFTQWLAGDNTKLISKITSAMNYIIENPDKISDNTLKSKTIFPELVIDNKTNSAYYDCPGFSDTEGTSNDIAQTYFIKKVLDFSESVKLLFVISHPSVIKGVDRTEFMKLLRHVTDLVKDVEKFKNSIAFVATKVDNRAVLIDGQFVMVKDSSVIAGIAGFLQEAKQYLQGRLSSSVLSEKEKKFCLNAIKFIEILLLRENEEYKRIGIFRRPDREGRVSEIPSLQEGKKNIENILTENLEFTAKNEEDFGYTVSERTKNDINALAEEFNKNLESGLTNVTKAIFDYYKDLVDSVRYKIDLLASEPNKLIDVSFSEASDFRSQFKIGEIVVSDIMNQTKYINNPQQLEVIVTTIVTFLDIDIPKTETISFIKNQGDYLNFLQQVSDRKLSKENWDQIFQPVDSFLADSKTDIQSEVKTAADKIKNHVQNRLSEIAANFQKEYSENIKSLDITILPKKLSYDGKIINLVLTREMSYETTTERLVKFIPFIAENLKVSLSKRDLKNIRNQGEHLRFLEVIENDILDYTKMNWLSPFQGMLRYFLESEKWYKFLADLYKTFSQYTIQKERQLYNVANLNDWGKPGKPQGISVTIENFKNEFMNKIESFNFAEFSTVQSLTPTDTHIEEINKVLTFTLKHRPKIICSDSHITVKGTFISLKEILNNLEKNLDTDNTCDNFKSKLDEGKYSLLKVFALNRVFLDANLSFKGKKMSVAIIAPHWEIIDSISIDLNGADGKSQLKAKNGKYPGIKGETGAPGKPGQSAESFFGIGMTFINAEKLKITADGGKGGPGQEGGDGHEGLEGMASPEPVDGEEMCDQVKQKFRNYFDCKLIKGPIEYDELGITTQWNFRIYGEEGGKGGDGGDGGKGGIGGDQGRIIMHGPSRSSKGIMFAGGKEEGESGKAGAGGKGGKDGDNRTARFYKKKLVDTCFANIFTGKPCDFKLEWQTAEIEKSTSRGPDGKKGIDGKNDDHIEHPKPANGFSNLPKIINEFKSFQRENLDNRFLKLHIISFLYILNNREYVRKLYDILGLVEEFQGLEDQFQKLGDQIDFSPFYSSMLERVIAYAKGRENIQNESKKILNYLYTSAMGRLYSLKKQSEKDLIIDMRGYLNMIESNIQKLKNLQAINNKVEVINKYKENYKNGIDAKFKEAQSLIENQLNPAMKKINAEIDDQINSLIKETISLQDSAVTDYKELAKNKLELQRTMRIKGIFNCLKIVGEVANLAGPYGQAAGTFINGVTTIAEPLALDKNNENLNVAKIVKNLGSTLSSLKANIEAIRGKKVERLENFLNNLDVEIKKNENLEDLGYKVGNITLKLKDVKKKQLNFNQVTLLEKDLEESIQGKLVNLKAIKDKDKKGWDAVKVMDKFFEVMKLGSLFSDMYEKHKEDQKAMDTITKAMDEKSSEMVMLRDYEKSIYDTIAPLLNKIESGLNDIKNVLGTKSHVALDITKWQVQSGLSDMKDQMEKLTEGKEANKDIKRSIEKLDEVMTTFINVYGRIQTYQDQQTLANYIADVSSAAANIINIKDKNFEKAKNYLEFSIRGNLVIEMYKSAIEALKQWVFPFTEKYIEKSMLPSTFKMEKNIENLVETTKTKIESIRSKIKLYDTSITKGDELLTCEEFNSKYMSSHPFYVWKNEENRRLISSLLSGKEVILNSPIQESPADKEAIKFSEMEFEFKIKNESAQSQFSKMLLGFDMKVTHLGNSYYIHEGKIYVLTSSSVTFIYSCERNEDGIPIRTNEAYNKLKSGDMLLSPYTFWKVTLIKKSTGYSFEDLSKYKNDVNIELSGLGIYISNAARADDNNTMANPLGSSSRECRRSKYRLKRSVNEVGADDGFMTNGASKVISSPFSLFYNFLNFNFFSNLVISLNIAFLGEKTAVRNDCSKLLDEFTVTRNIGPSVVSHPAILEIEATSEEIINTQEGIEQKSDTFFNVKFQDNDTCLKSFLPGDQKLEISFPSIQVPDLNYALLLADLVTRTITQKKYKSPVDECFLSPRELKLARLSDGVLRNERELKQMLRRHLSENEVRRSSSWFSTMKGYGKSVLQMCGLLDKNDTEAYVQDIQQLFT